jgi:hypothetical protein
MNCASPVAININAGINIQNHQPYPIVLDNTIEMMTNAMPMKKFLKECSSVSSLPRLVRQTPSTSFTGGCCWS